MAKKRKSAGAKKSAAPKSSPAPQAQTQPRGPNESRKMIPQQTLRTLLNTCKRLSDKAGTITGELGQEIASAANRHNFNRKAFNTIRMLDKMEPEKLADFIDEFEYMFDVSGLKKRAESVQRLALDDGDKDDEQETGGEAGAASEATAEPGQPGSNIAPFKKLVIPPDTQPDQVSQG